MSDLEEMAKELKRAIELEDRPAVEMIADEMFREAQLLQLSDTGESLLEAISSGNYGAALVYSSSLGRRAAEIDLQRGQFFGPSFAEGRLYIDAISSRLQN